MNQYEINDNYGYQNYEYLDEVIEKVFEHEKVHNAICSIIFVSNEEIHEITVGRCKGTKKELRPAHNLERMLLAGAFDWFKE